MSQKAHPKIFRIGFTENWFSRWFTKKNFVNNLKEDFLIRRFFRKQAREWGIEKVEIERQPGLLKIIIFSARPGILIGRGGEGIEKIKNQLKKEILKEQKTGDFKIEVIEVKDPWLSASLVAQWVADQLERRIPHRTVMKQAMAKIFAKKEVKGARVELGGRLDGAEIARNAWLQKGRLPRQTIRANVDFAEETAILPYGTIGVKVWLYKEKKAD
jgi:small subunit ribosomal protein S3